MKTQLKITTALVIGSQAIDLGVEWGGKEWRSGEV